MIQILYHDTAFPSQLLLPSQYTNVYCDTLFSAIQVVSVTIQNLYRDTAFPPANLHAYCNTLPTHCTPSYCVTIQFPCIMTQFPSPTACPKMPMSRYNFPLYCDTVLGSSPAKFATFFVFLFFFFTHIFFSLLHFCYWKHPKIHIHIFFFSFFSTPNKFIKFIFTHFSSVLLTVKPKNFPLLIIFFSHFHQ